MLPHTEPRATSNINKIQYKSKINTEICNKIQQHVTISSTEDTGTGSILEK